MRYGILSDVHANSVALEAVQKHVFQEKTRIDSWWFLGDAVGYGPFPVEALRLLRQMVPQAQWRIGNHDAMFVGLIPPPSENDNGGASMTIKSNRAMMQDEDPALWRWCQRTWTARKEEAIELKLPGSRPKLHVWLAHASLQLYAPSEQIRTYLFPWRNTSGVDDKSGVIKKLLSMHQPGQCCLLLHGHTHVPYAYGVPRGQSGKLFLPVNYSRPIYLDDFDALLINPGSVGLPRNADPVQHTAYGVLDTRQRTFQFCRAPYNPEEVILEMYRRDYPLEYRLFLQGAGPGNPLRNQVKKVWEWTEWERRYRWEGDGWAVISQED